MMDRRRALMMAKEDGNHLKYSLYNRTVAAGEQINTLFNPQANGVSTTILLDITLTSNPTSGYGRLWKLLAGYNQPLNARGLYLGKKSGAASVITLWWMGTEHTATPSSYSQPNRYRYAITHQADSNSIAVSVKKGGSDRIFSYEFTDTFTPADDNTLYLGGGQNNDHSLPDATINACEIYDTILNTSEINAFFA